MQKELEQALEQICQGETAKTEQVVARIKALHRDADGVFDLSGIEGAQAIKRMLYPVYAAYETSCNRKEGYGDILMQMRVMDKRLQEQYDSMDAAVYMDIVLRTLTNMSQEIYECYRELVDLYKKNVRRFIREYCGESGTSPETALSGEAEALLGESICQACRQHILLEDKYEKYFSH